ALPGAGPGALPAALPGAGPGTLPAALVRCAPVTAARTGAQRTVARPGAELPRLTRSQPPELHPLALSQQTPPYFGTCAGIAPVGAGPSRQTARCRTGLAAQPARCRTGPSRSAFTVQGRAQPLSLRGAGPGPAAQPAHCRTPPGKPPRRWQRMVSGER